MNLLRISALDVDGWDAQYLSKQVDFSSLMGEATRRFEDVDKTMPDGLMVKNESFAKWAQKTRWMKHFYETKFAPQKALPQQTLGPEETAEQIANGNSELLQDARTTLNQLGLGPSVQQPTPNEDWGSTSLMTAPVDLFTNFDDPFWSSYNFNDVDLNMQSLPGMDMV